MKFKRVKDFPVSVIDESCYSHDVAHDILYTIAKGYEISLEDGRDYIDLYLKDGKIVCKEDHRTSLKALIELLGLTKIRASLHDELINYSVLGFAP